MRWGQARADMERDNRRRVAWSEVSEPGWGRRTCTGGGSPEQVLKPQQGKGGCHTGAGMAQHWVLETRWVRRALP